MSRKLAVLAAVVFLLSSTSPLLCADLDGDGFEPPADCNDTEATVYPGGPELCDGRDNDCNVSVDEGVVRSCDSGCAIGVEFCSNGTWLGCTAKPCCDFVVGSGGDFPTICPAAQDFAFSYSPTTFCVKPGSYTAPCTVTTSLVSTDGPDTTIIAGDISMRGRFSNQNTRLQGFTILGTVNANSFEASADLLGNYIVGSAVVIGPYSDGVCRYAIGNRVEGMLTGFLGYFIYQNSLEGGGLTAAGDFVRCDAVIQNTILNTQTAITAVESIGTFMIRGNRIENCDVGIMGSSSTPELPESFIIGNTIDGCRIGIDFDYAPGERARIWNNRISNSREYGIKLGGANLELGQNLVTGTGLGDPAGDPGAGVSIALFGGAAKLVYNTVAANRSGVEVRLFGENNIGLTGNLIAANSADGLRIETLTPEYPFSVSASRNDVFGNGANWVGVADPTGSNGNIAVNPRFAAPGSGDFRLAAGSPLVDLGEPFGVSKDIDGLERVQDGDLDGRAAPDLGAFELSPQIVAAVVPSQVNPAKGSQITSCVSIDLSNTTELLASYGALLSWDATVLQWVGFGGGDPPFNDPFVEVISEGEIRFSDSDAPGATGRSRILCAEFRVTGEAGTASRLDLELVRLSASDGSGSLLAMAAARDAAINVVTNCLVGDVSLDGDIQSEDAALVLAGEVELALPGPVEEGIIARCGDGNGDGSTDSIDANVVLSALRGREINLAFPFGKSNQTFDSCQPAEVEQGLSLADPSTLASPLELDAIEAGEPAVSARLTFSKLMPRRGEEFEVAVLVDLGASGSQLGSYGVRLGWNSSAVEFVGLGAGGSGTFNSPVVNLSRAASGEMLAADASPEGDEGTVVLIRGRFRALRAVRRLGALFRGEFTSMGSVAPQFENMLPLVKWERQSRSRL